MHRTRSALALLGNRLPDPPLHNGREQEIRSPGCQGGSTARDTAMAMPAFAVDFQQRARLGG